MIIPNNFKEIKITQNEDNTYKIEYYGVIFKDANGQELEDATVTLPRVKMNITSFPMFSNKTQIEIEVFPDFTGQLETICIPEENNNV